MFFDTVFFQQLVTTFVGVVLGIGAAFWVDRKLSERRNKEALSRLILSIEKSLSTNLSLLSSLEDDLKKENGQYFPLYPTDLVILDATGERKYEFDALTEWWIKIDQIRYELKHLEERLKLIRQLFINPTVDKDPVLEERLSLLQKKTLAHIPKIRELINKALAEIPLKKSS